MQEVRSPWTVLECSGSTPHSKNSQPRTTALRLRDADHAAGNASPSIAGWLALQIIWVGVGNEGASNDGMRPAQLDLAVADVDDRLAGAIRLDVTEVSDMALLGMNVAVRLAIGIEMGAGGHRIRGTAIAELVDVKRMHPRLEPHDFSADLNLIPTWCEPNRAVR